MDLIFFWTNAAAVQTDPILFLLTIQDLKPFSLDLRTVDPGIDLIKWLMIDNHLRTA
jgi:hypothetical protein